MASTRLTKTYSSSGNRNKWTWSSWIKRSGISSNNRIFGVYQNSAYGTTCYFDGGDNLYFIDTYNNVDQARAGSNAKYRDTSAWYHIVVVYDKDNSTSADKLILYVNGERISLSNYTAPTQATTFNVDGLEHEIGAYNSSEYFNGSMSHINFVDGTAYDATAFGQYDANGVWTINTSPSVTYGTNGFFILKDGNSVTDQSGNSNNFTVGGGTLTKTEDNPSNVFATLNVLDSALGYTGVPINGNLTINGSANDRGLRGTLGASSGKYYWEIKMNEKGNIPGVARADAIITFDANITPGYWSIQSNGTGSDMKSYTNGTPDTTNALQGYANGTIVGIALDMDNGKVYYSYDGVFKGLNNNTSDPVNQTNPTFTGIPNTFMLPWIEHRTSTANGSQFNFGNGYFGTTAVASAGTNASGIGIFEYDVPTGYTALSTKGLNL